MQFDCWRWFARPRTLGQRGEALAARFLKKKGYTILARSYRTALGELDLVAVDPNDVRGSTIIFAEVKTRKGTRAGYPEEAVDRRKQHKLSQLAEHYRAVHNVEAYPARFDVIAVEWPEQHKRPRVTHFPDAFDASLGDVMDA